jgi:hypothetical protein
VDLRPGSVLSGLNFVQTDTVVLPDIFTQFRFKHFQLFFFLHPCRVNSGKERDI